MITVIEGTGEKPSTDELEERRQAIRNEHDDNVDNALKVYDNEIMEYRQEHIEKLAVRLMCSNRYDMQGALVAARKLVAMNREVKS